MKRYRSERKGRRNFDPSADGRYTTIVCDIMARKDADRKGGATNSPLTPFFLPVTVLPLMQFDIADALMGIPIVVACRFRAWHGFATNTFDIQGL